LGGESIAAFTAVGSNTDCHILWGRVNPTGADIVLSCRSYGTTDGSVSFGSPTGSQAVVLPVDKEIALAVRFDNTGNVVLHRQLVSYNDAYENFSAGVLGAVEKMYLHTNAWQGAGWGEGALYEDEPISMVSGERIATYDEDFNLVDVVRFNNGEVSIDSIGDRYIRLTNSDSYTQIGDFVSIAVGTILAKRSDNSLENWTVRAGAVDALISDQKDALAILTSSDKVPLFVGSGEKKQALTSPEGIDISYLVRLSDADGSLVSAASAFTISTNETDHPECEQDLYECTDDILTFGEAAAYRGVPSEPLYLYNLAWQSAAAWVDESCITLCGSEETCDMKAECTQDNGVTVDFSIQTVPDEINPYSLLNDYREFHVQSENGDTGWRDLFLSYDWEKTYGMMDMVDSVSSQHQIEWTGSWFDSLPEDGTMTFSKGTFQDPEGMYAGSSCSLTINTCDITWSQGTNNFGFAGSETVIVNGNTYLSKDTVNPPVYGFINDECIGEIDASTWQIIGPCAD
jgi:hypothetical protein